MSTFSGLGTALSSLIAQRQGLEVSGQNIANANTVGYTRQRAVLSSLPASTVPSMFSTSSGVGQGVFTTGFERMGDIFVDARLRTETSGAALLKQLSTSYAQLEDGLGEPSENGLSKQLTDMWKSWSEVSKASETNGDAARSVLLQNAGAVAQRLGTLYSSAETQWNQTRTATTSLVTEVNTTATNIADLNERILAITNSGGSANELKDARDVLITQLSGLVGATARIQENGTVDVQVGGNSLVSGNRVSTLEVTGARSFEQAMSGGTVQITWSKNGASAGLDGGRVAGLLTVMAPPNANGTGGMLTEAATSYNALATTIADQVNAIHSTGYTVEGYATGTPAGDFFTFTAGKPAALGLTVAITDVKDIAVAADGAGELDGSVGDLIAGLGTKSDGPDAAWSATVVQIGVRAGSASSRASVAEAARATSEAQQLAQTSVDTDEESINMLAFQRAYEGAARVLTAIDEMLDTLINRTGVVGR